MTKARIPAEAFHPGEHLRDELEARGWSVEELAARTLLDRAALDDLLAGRRGINAQIAHALAEATGVSFGLWMGLELSWRRWLRFTQPDAVDPRDIRSLPHERVPGEMVVGEKGATNDS